MRVLIAIIWYCLSCGVVSAYAQNTPSPILDTVIKYSPYTFGIFGSGGENLHTASFSGFKGIPSCCPEYTNANALGSSFGFIGNYALTPQFGIGLRAGFNGLGGNFASEEIQYVMSQQGFATITHSLETSIGVLSLEPQAIYSVGNANLSGGLWFGLPLSMTFSQRESIFPGTFDGLNRVRNELSGDIPSIPPILMGISGGISYEFPLNKNKNLRIAPEVRGFALLNELSESTNWKTIGIRAGLSVLWTSIEKIPPPPPLPPPIKQLPELLTSLKVSEDNIHTKHIDSFLLTETIHQVVQPILPYVFFEDESAEIATRYQLLSNQQAEQFNEQSLISLDVLKRYYHILNLAGLRLRNDTSLRLTITGTTSGAGKERRNIQLAKNRAQVIARYLYNIWNIDSTRLLIQAKGMPDNPSNNAYPEGMAENRRVELEFSDPRVFEVLTIMDSVLTVKPEQAFVKGELESGTMIDKWRLTIMTDTNYLHESLGMHDTFVGTTLKIEPDKLGKTLDSLRFRYNVVDTAGRSRTSSIVIPISYQQIFINKSIVNTENDNIKRYSLILFDFDESTLIDRNMRVIDAIKAKNNIEIVSIIGATDRFGDQERNAKLAIERAMSVGKLLNVNPSIIQSNSTYEGTSNEVPEGRFYNRTVIIEAKED
jgi:outer membrane protein OmpA-like peptidoglycan-associated protein